MEGCTLIAIKRDGTDGLPLKLDKPQFVIGRFLANLSLGVQTTDTF
jgi:hypothetical protein